MVGAELVAVIRAGEAVAAFCPPSRISDAATDLTAAPCHKLMVPDAVDRTLT